MYRQTNLLWGNYAPSTDGLVIILCREGCEMNPSQGQKLPNVWDDRTCDTRLVLGLERLIDLIDYRRFTCPQRWSIKNFDNRLIGKKIYLHVSSVCNELHSCSLRKEWQMYRATQLIRLIFLVPYRYPTKPRVCLNWPWVLKLSCRGPCASEKLILLSIKVAERAGFIPSFVRAMHYRY